jgi:phosphoribosylformylglycinamidine cyclo-ligase
MTYGGVGIDLEKVHAIQKSISSKISLTYDFTTMGKVISGFGHYAGLVDIGTNVLALHSDGVGTKVIVAQMMRRYDSIGIDCVAMNVNDIICVGAHPLAFTDYVALKSADDHLVQDVLKGLTEGSKQSDMAIIGGETAILPDVITGKNKNAFDLAGTVLGVVDKANLVLGDKIKIGDIILGVESSGLHSNGYSLARNVLLSKYSIKDTAEYMSDKIGEELLIPTRIYVKPVMEILKRKQISVHGLAHITGGSFTKLARLNSKVRYNLDNLPKICGIFKQIQIDGHIRIKEMYRTFNMGIGFCVILPKYFAEEVIDTFTKYRMECRQIGVVDQKNRDEKIVAKIDGRNHML